MFRSKSLLKFRQAIINQQLGNKTCGTSLYKLSNSFDGQVSNRIENLKHPLENNSLRRTNSEINSTKILKKTKSCNFLSQINNFNKTLSNHKLSASCCTLSGYNTYPYLENELFSRITNETKIVYRDKNFNIELNKKYSVCRSNKYESNKKNSFKYTSSNKLRIAHIQQKQKLNYPRKIKTGTIKKRIQNEKFQIQAYKVYSYEKNVNEKVDVDTKFSNNKTSNTISKKKDQNKKESRIDVYLSETNMKPNYALDVNRTPKKLAERKAKYTQNGYVKKISNNPVYSSGDRASLSLSAQFINRRINILPRYQSYNTITTTANNAANTLRKKEKKTINSIQNEKQYSLNDERNGKVRSLSGENKLSTISQDDSVYLNNVRESNQVSTINTKEQLSIKDLICNNTVLLLPKAGKDFQVNESEKECILTSTYTRPTVINYDKFSSETTNKGLIESDLSKKEMALLSIYSGENNYLKSDNTSIRKQQSVLYEEEKNNRDASTKKYEKQIENKLIKDVNVNKIRDNYSAVMTKRDSNYFLEAPIESISIANQTCKVQTDQKLHDNLLQSEKKPVTSQAVSWKRGRNYQQLKSKIYYLFDKVIYPDNVVLNTNEMESVPWIRDTHYEQIKETKNFKQKNDINKKGNVEKSTDEVGWIKGRNIGEAGRSHKNTSKLNYHPNHKENEQMIFSFPINYLKGVRVTNSDKFSNINSENCTNTTSATAWMRNNYTKSENSLFNHFHEIKFTANNKNYSQAACETNVTAKEKSKNEKIDNKSDSKKELKLENTWKQSTFQVDKEKPIIDLNGKKISKLQETNNTNTKFDLMTSKETKVNERYQHKNTDSKHKNFSTAVLWVQNQNNIMKDETFDTTEIGKQNLPLSQSSTHQTKQEKTDHSHQYLPKNKINCSLSYNKQPSKHEEVPSTLKETKISAKGNNEALTNRSTSNKPIMTKNIECEPISNINTIGSSNNCNKTRKNNAETKSELLVLWKKDDEIKNGKIVKSIANLTEQTNFQQKKINGQLLPTNKSTSNTLLNTGVAWERNGCMTNNENYLNCIDNLTKSTKNLQKQKKANSQMSGDAIKNLNQSKMNENNIAVSCKQKLIDDKESLQSIYGRAEERIREDKKLPGTNNNIKETSITADSESKIPLNSETKKINPNDVNESRTKKINSQISKETITNRRKKSLNNNLIIQQNLKGSPDKSQSTTDSNNKIQAKISSANAARNCDQIRGDKMIIQPDCKITKLQKQNDQFKQKLIFTPKIQKEGTIKAAYPIDAEEFKEDKNKNIQANDIKELDDKKEVGIKELHKKRIPSDKKKSSNFKQTQIEGINNIDTQSETKKKLKLCFEKNNTSRKDVMKKQNAIVTETVAEELTNYLTHITDNKTHSRRMQEFYEFEEKLLGLMNPQTNVYSLDETSQTEEAEDALKKNIILESNGTPQCNNKRTESSSTLIQNNITQNKSTRGKNSLTITEEQIIAEQNKDNDTHKKEKLPKVKRDAEELTENLTHITDNKTHSQRMQEFYEFEEKLLGFKNPQTKVYCLDETSQTEEAEDALKKNIILESNGTPQCNNKRTESSSTLIQNNITQNKSTRGKNSLTTTEEQIIAEKNKDNDTHKKEKLPKVKPSIRNEAIPNKLCTGKSFNTIQGKEMPIKESNALIGTSCYDKNKSKSTTIGDESTKLTKISTADGSVNPTKTNIKPENYDSIKQSQPINKQTEKKTEASEKSVATRIRNQLFKTNSSGQSTIVNEKSYNLPTTETIVRLETTPVKSEQLVHHTIAQANKNSKKIDENNNKYEKNSKIFKNVKSQEFNRTTKNSEMEQSVPTFTKSKSEILHKEATKLLKNVENISHQENVTINTNMLKQIYDTGMNDLYEGPTENNLNKRSKRQNDSKSQSNFYSDCTKILQNDSMTIYAPNKSISVDSILMNNEQNKAEAHLVNKSSPILKTMLKAVVYTVFNNRNPHDQLIESEMINSKEMETIKREEEEKEACKKCNSENELSPWLTNDDANDAEEKEEHENQFLMPINDKRFPMINDNKMMFEYPKSPTTKIINCNEEMVYQHIPSVSKILNGTLPKSAKKELENWEINHLTTLGKTQFIEYYRGQIKNDIQFHDCIRRHILGTPLSILTESANIRLKGCLTSLKGILSKLKNVTVLESPVVHPVLPYHGIVDCVACYNNNPVLIEWKQADRSRPIKELMYDAPVQLAAYIGAMNHDQHYKLPINSGIIVVAYTDGSPADVLTITKKQLEKNWKIWLERLESYMESK